MDRGNDDFWEATAYAILMAGQARFTREEFEASLAESSLSEAARAIVRKRIRPLKGDLPRLKRERRIVAEAEAYFRFLLALLERADGRRRREEGGACTRHWWHRDLSDPEVVAQILDERGVAESND